jgi:DNA-directed RNA polymerase subunit alpha
LKSDNSSVDDLPLPTRTINALKKHGINTLSDLRTKSDEEISDIKNLGEKSIDEIKKLLGR